MNLEAGNKLYKPIASLQVGMHLILLKGKRRGFTAWPDKHCIELASSAQHSLKYGWASNHTIGEMMRALMI